MLDFISKIFDTNQQDLNKIQPYIDKINSLEDEYKSLENEELRSKTDELKSRLSRGETLDDILPDAFALVREASLRTLGMRHYDVQLIAGVAFHQGKVAEQKTGEGKTLSATLALYLNALTGQGAHLVTVNDYLAQRDAGWNAPMFDLLGISVGVIIPFKAFVYDSEYQGEDRGDERLEKLRPVDRKEAYAADITYGTSQEFGFDYLRDNMAQTKDRVVQRGHHYAIIDEVDSILIDEARTPLIISAPDDEPTDKYVKFADLVQQLQPEVDYEVDEKLKTATLTDQGIVRVEAALGVDNLYERDFETIHHIEQALKAKTVYLRDKEYVVRDNQVIIVDENTGRLMPGRRYSEGLHQAIEAKEGVEIQRETRTMATISMQNYFRMYQKLAGMTGTAETEAQEFKTIYDMDVLVVPTNRPIARVDHADAVYKTKEAKYRAIVKEVSEKYKKGQPVLLGTRSVEQNDVISRYLKKAKIPHQTLNAKNHEQEANIIANAGMPGSITVATNIAGRGVDIVLGGAPPERPGKNASEKEQKAYEKQISQWREKHQQVLELGGLHVIGTERHESRRIDNQLRGRSGRQGDPGSSRFYVALDDEIMRVFGGEQVAKIMTALKVPEDQPIEAKLVNRSIANAQSKVEGFYFDQRKNVVEYDDVLNKQRDIIYTKRNQILDLDPETDADELHQKVLDIIKEQVELLVTSRMVAGLEAHEIDNLVKEFASIVPFDSEALSQLSQDLVDETEPEPVISRLQDLAADAHAQRTEELGQTNMARMEQFTLLKSIDELWVDHLDAIDDLRQAIRTRGSKETVIAEYKKEAFDLFSRLVASINSQVSRRVLRTQVVDPNQARTSINLDNLKLSQPQAQSAVEASPEISTNQVESQPSPSSTDNPFAAALARSGQKPVVKDKGIKKKKIGRNDPCPCGSGLKWKKCGMIGSPKHQT